MWLGLLTLPRIRPQVSSLSWSFIYFGVRTSRSKPEGRILCTPLGLVRKILFIEPYRLPVLLSLIPDRLITNLQSRISNITSPIPFSLIT